MEEPPAGRTPQGALPLVADAAAPPLDLGAVAAAGAAAPPFDDGDAAASPLDLGAGAAADAAAPPISGTVPGPPPNEAAPEAAAWPLAVAPAAAADDATALPTLRTAEPPAAGTGAAAPTECGCVMTPAAPSQGPRGQGVRGWGAPRAQCAPPGSRGERGRGAGWRSGRECTATPSRPPLPRLGSALMRPCALAGSPTHRVRTPPPAPSLGRYELEPPLPREGVALHPRFPTPAPSLPALGAVRARPTPRSGGTQRSTAGQHPGLTLMRSPGMEARPPVPARGSRGGHPPEIPDSGSPGR